jgi:hypothetical protein
LNCVRFRSHVDDGRWQIEDSVFVIHNQEVLRVEEPDRQDDALTGT